MKKILGLLITLSIILSFTVIPVNAANYNLSGVNGWAKSNWNIPDAEHTAGIDVINVSDATTVAIPSGDNMLKVWAGAPTNYANLNANAVQSLTGLTVGATYVLTGKVWQELYCKG